MKNSGGWRGSRGFIIICVALLMLANLPSLSSARSATNSINIVNNSNRQIRHVFLSHVSADDWSGDQLSSALQPGQSITVSNFACDQAEIKVIGEDQDGCFLTTVVACGDGASWTITNDSVADCGQ